MIIAIHIIIAIASLIIATLAAFKPSTRALITNYSFIAGTVLSGSYLIVTMPSSLVSSCISGLVYFAVAIALSVVAQLRLSKLAQQTHQK